jgi:Holliday junction resolvase RusA-like endonuclease
VGLPMIQLVVPGVPIPQGSKNPWGGEDNPHTKSWRASIAARALESAVDGPLLGPVEVDVEFVFPRPKAHYRTGRYSDELRADAPYWHVGKPDLDKLERAIGDALNGILIRDDSQIALWFVRKHYGTSPRATIKIETLELKEEIE